VLIAFAFGLTFNGLSLLLIRSLFSLRATWLPALVAVVTLVVNVVLDVLLYEQWGVLGIAAAISAANIVAVVLLYFMLQRRTDPLGTRRTLAVAGGSLGVGIVGVAAAAGVYIAWEQWAGRSGITSFVGVCAALAVMTPIYLELGARVGVVPRGLLRSILRRQ
jgi:putative peptidoglycan lipid II flippase